MSNNPALPSRSTNVPDNPKALPYQYQHEAYRPTRPTAPYYPYRKIPTNTQTESHLHTNYTRNALKTGLPAELDSVPKPKQQPTPMPREPLRVPTTA